MTTASALPDSLSDAARRSRTGPHRLLIGGERLPPPTGAPSRRSTRRPAGDRGGRARRAPRTSTRGRRRRARRSRTGAGASSRPPAHARDADARRPDRGARRGAGRARVARQRQAGHATRAQIDVRADRRPLPLLRGLADEDRGRGRSRSRRRTMLCYTRKEPVGVCGQIIPWNFPLLMAAVEVAPGARGGLHDRAEARRADAADARCGSASSRSRPASRTACSTSSPATATTGAALVDHPGVDKIAFTGSTAVGPRDRREGGPRAEARDARAGRQVAEHHPPRRRPEGGDRRARSRASTSTPARPATPARACSCTRTSSTRSSSALAERAPKTEDRPRPRPGHAARPAGVGRAARARRPATSRRARREGAELVAGGGARDGDRATSSSRRCSRRRRDDIAIAREEIFGPVLVALPYESIEEVARARERHRVRPRGRRLDARHRERAPPRGAAAGRHGLRERLGR